MPDFLLEIAFWRGVGVQALFLLIAYQLGRWIEGRRWRSAEAELMTDDEITVTPEKGPDWIGPVKFCDAYEGAFVCQTHGPTCNGCASCTRVARATALLKPGEHKSQCATERQLACDCGIADAKSQCRYCSEPALFSTLGGLKVCSLHVRGNEAVAQAIHE